MASRHSWNGYYCSTIPLASNYDWPLPKSPESRRWPPLPVGQIQRCHGQLQLHFSAERQKQKQKGKCLGSKRLQHLYFELRLKGLGNLSILTLLLKEKTNESRNKLQVRQQFGSFRGRKIHVSKINFLQQMQHNGNDNQVQSNYWQYQLESVFTHAYAEEPTYTAYTFSRKYMKGEKRNMLWHQIKFIGFI